MMGTEGETPAMRAVSPAINPGVRARRLAGLALLLVTLATFAPVYRFDFIAYDDPLYVNHPRVLKGLTWENLLWSLVSLEVANWHPVTWLSHMLDAQLWGTDPGPPHLMNAAIHAVNALLLFLILDRLTGRSRLALIAAALFALHPLRVETVAWVSERKDVLCALFFLLTIAAYAACVKRPSLLGYLLVAAMCLLALMSKPMAVTLPFVLLLLDYWPLGRLRIGRNDSDAAGEPISRLLAEKLPLFVLALATAILTVLAQKDGGAVVALSQRGLADRIANALLAYAAYIGKLLWPTDLVILYPLAETWSMPAVVTAAIALAGVTLLALLTAGRRPFLIVGWLWFLGTLVPVIGLVQAGAQAIADRYTYIPCVGLTVAMVWGAASLVERRRAARVLAAGGVAVALCLLVLLTLRQLCYWQGGTFALFRQALSVNEKNQVAHYQVAVLLAEQGQTDAALQHATRARALAPRYNKPHYLLGNLLRDRGRLREAIASYTTALKLDSSFAPAWRELSIAQAMQGDHDDAERSLSRAVELDPAAITVKRRLTSLRRRAAQRAPGT